MKNKRKHLELIQGIINRMASNLFFLRGWTITLIATLLTEQYTFNVNQLGTYSFLD